MSHPNNWLSLLSQRPITRELGQQTNPSIEQAIDNKGLNIWKHSPHAISGSEAGFPKAEWRVHQRREAPAFRVMMRRSKPVRCMRVQVPSSQGLANQIDPKSCVRASNRLGEALTGERTG